MHINNRLNLVSTLNRADGSIAYIHAVPLPFEVVEENCVLLGNLFSNFMGLVGTIGAPRVAGMMLRKRISSDRAAGIIPADGPTVVDAIQRTSTFIYSDKGEWKTIPLTVALTQELLSPEEFRDVEGELVFFMVASAIQRANLIPITVGKSLAMYSAQLTSSSITEWKNSLPTSSSEKSTPNQQEQPAQPDQSFIPS